MDPLAYNKSSILEFFNTYQYLQKIGLLKNQLKEDEHIFLGNRRSIRDMYFVYISSSSRRYISHIVPEKFLSQERTHWRLSSLGESLGSDTLRIMSRSDAYIELRDFQTKKLQEICFVEAQCRRKTFIDLIGERNLLLL